MALRENRGFHPILEDDHPYLFIDTCMQSWPDADYGIAHQHGVTGYAVTAFRPHSNFDNALEDLMYWHLLARTHENLRVATTAEHLENAKTQRISAFILAAQGGDWIEDRLHRIEAFQRLGLRMLIFAYNSSNMLAAGCLDNGDDGLTALGEVAVQECNRTGIIIDCSHLGKRSSLDCINLSEAPVVFSHSNVNALVSNPRNIDDEQIRECAARGGVICLAPWAPLVLPEHKTEWPDINDFIDHIDYVADLTGSTDHIGIGTDMSLGSYPIRLPDPWGQATSLSEVTAHYDQAVTNDLRSPKQSLADFNSYPQIVGLADALEARGYSASDIDKMLGRNYLRIAKKVWRA